MGNIQIENLTKSYDGKNNVLEQFNLHIDNGEFLVLLGPSGCGKSTLLRLIAGLEDLQEGSIAIDDNCINDIAPKDRDIAMVFQNYALYPHMSVYKNIAIPLVLKKEDKQAIDKKVHSVAEILDIETLLERKPRQLSGGQMQRVALARAMIRNPKVFLMDEPLSNLDAKLRIQTRGEIIKLHKRLGITTVYVTHDQVEAMTMATRIVLMNKGKIMQAGKPDALYHRPKNLFTATFIGSPEINLIPARIESNKFQLFNETFDLNVADQDIIVGIRSEDIQITAGENFTVDIVENLGAEKLITTVYKHDKNLKLTAKSPANVPITLGDKVNLTFSKERLHVFNKNSEKRIN